MNYELVLFVVDAHTHQAVHTVLFILQSTSPSVTVPSHVAGMVTVAEWNVQTVGLACLTTEVIACGQLCNYRVYI